MYWEHAKEKTATKIGVFFLKEKKMQSVLNRKNIYLEGFYCYFELFHTKLNKLICKLKKKKKKWVLLQGVLGVLLLMHSLCISICLLVLFMYISQVVSCWVCAGPGIYLLIYIYIIYLSINISFYPIYPIHQFIIYVYILGSKLFGVYRSTGYLSVYSMFVCAYICVRPSLTHVRRSMVLQLQRKVLIGKTRSDQLLITQCAGIQCLPQKVLDQPL